MKSRVKKLMLCCLITINVMVHHITIIRRPALKEPLSKEYPIGRMHRQVSLDLQRRSDKCSLLIEPEQHVYKVNR